VAAFAGDSALARFVESNKTGKDVVMLKKLTNKRTGSILS
jgi:hypothetical protein